MARQPDVGTGRITPNRFVELVSTNIAKLFGLYPRKGTIAPGSDADLVVWDPNKKLTISAATHHTNVNYTLFEGTEVTGAPEVVLVRGLAPRNRIGVTVGCDTHHGNRFRCRHHDGGLRLCRGTTGQQGKREQGRGQAK